MIACCAWSAGGGGVNAEPAAAELAVPRSQIGINLYGLAPYNRQQVFTNLINNAVKYSPQLKQVDIYITVSQNTVTVSVRDYGIGIPKEHQQKIFDRFYRVSDVHDKTSPGLGMGLYISSEIVKRHGGRLWVESAENKGATFFVSLPVA